MPDALTRGELSLLLFLETQAVDNRGRVRSERMSADDFTITKRWNESGYIQFGRLKMAEITDQRTMNKASHWCRLSDQAWKDAHAERRSRASRNEAVKDYPHA